MALILFCVNCGSYKEVDPDSDVSDSECYQADHILWCMAGEVQK